MPDGSQRHARSRQRITRHLGTPVEQARREGFDDPAAARIHAARGRREDRRKYRHAEHDRTWAQQPVDQHSIIRRAENQEVMRGPAGVERRIMIDDPKRGFELAENRYEPGTASAPAPLHHLGNEFGIVLEGQLEVTVDGRVHVARTGDAIKLDSTHPHRFRNPGPQVTRTLWVNITDPEGGHNA